METEDNIIDTIIKLMEQTENFSEMNGLEKQKCVLSGLKIMLGDEVYARYEYFIIDFIDFTIKISKGKKIKLNKSKYCCYK